MAFELQINPGEELVMLPPKFTESLTEVWSAPGSDEPGSMTWNLMLTGHTWLEAPILAEAVNKAIVKELGLQNNQVVVTHIFTVPTESLNVGDSTSVVMTMVTLQIVHVPLEEHNTFQEEFVLLAPGTGGGILATALLEERGVGNPPEGEVSARVQLVSTQGSFAASESSDGTLMTIMIAGIAVLILAAVSCCVFGVYYKYYRQRGDP